MSQPYASDRGARVTPLTGGMMVALGAALVIAGCRGAIMDAPNASEGGRAAPDDGDPGSLETASVPGPARLVRLDGASYRNALTRFFEGRAADENTDLGTVGGLPTVFGWENPADRFSTRNRSYGIDGNDFARLEAIARTLSEERVAGLSDGDCVVGTGLDDDACQRGIVAETAEILLGRPLTSDALDEAMGVVGDDDAADGMAARAGLRTRLYALLLSPSFLFREELGAPGEAGTSQPLTAHELASAVSYVLARRPPDALLEQAAIDGSLLDTDVLIEHLDRLMASPAHAAQVRRFLRELWRYGEASNVAKDLRPSDVFPPDATGADGARYRPERLVADTERLVAALVTRHRGEEFIRAQLTTTTAFVTRDTAIFYNVASHAEEPEEITVDPSIRKGMMGQPSWLVAFSEPDHNSPIRRGLFIQESLLCGEVPDLPIDGVPALELEGRTLRDALAAHTETGTACHGCHQYMDPMGLPFERFDLFGRWRAEELGAPVDTTGALVWSHGDFDQAGPVAGPGELADRLAASPLVERCFFRHALEFWLGRDVGEGDEATIDAAAEAYRSAGGDFDAGLRAILTSEVFRHRMQPPG